MAASLGIQVRRYRVIAFVISAVLASVAGSLIVEFSTYASPDNFNGDVGILVFAMLFIGGIRTASGPIIGAAIVTVVPVEATAIGKYSALTFELILLLILVVWPRGLGISVAKSTDGSAANTALASLDYVGAQGEYKFKPGFSFGSTNPYVLASTANNTDTVVYQPTSEAAS